MSNMSFKVGDRVVTDGGGYVEADDETPVEHGRRGVVTGVVTGAEGAAELYDVILDGFDVPSGRGIDGGLAFYPSEILGLEGEV